MSSPYASMTPAAQLWKDEKKFPASRITFKLSPARPEFIAPGALNAWFQFERTSNDSVLAVVDRESAATFDLLTLEERSRFSFTFSSTQGYGGYDSTGGEWSSLPESFRFSGDVAMSKVNAGVEQTSIVLWGVANGRKLRTFSQLHTRGGWIPDLQMDRYKIVAAINQERNPCVKVLDIETGYCINTVNTSSGINKVQFDETRIVASCRDGILMWDMRTNGALGPEGNKPIRKIHPPKYSVVDLKMRDHKIGYCGNRQVVLWDERVAFQPSPSPSSYQGYTFYEHREFNISALQFDDAKAVVALLDGTGTVDMLEYWTPSANQHQIRPSELSSVLKSYRKLAIDVDKEKKKFEKGQKKDKKQSYLDKMRIGSRPTLPEDAKREERRVEKLAEQRAIRSTSAGIPSVGLFTHNSIQYDDDLGLVVSGGGDGFIHIWRLRGGGALATPGFSSIESSTYQAPIPSPITSVYPQTTPPVSTMISPPNPMSSSLQLPYPSGITSSQHNARQDHLQSSFQISSQLQLQQPPPPSNVSVFHPPIRQLKPNNN